MFMNTEEVEPENMVEKNSWQFGGQIRSAMFLACVCTYEGKNAIVFHPHDFFMLMVKLPIFPAVWYIPVDVRKSL